MQNKYVCYTFNRKYSYYSVGGVLNGFNGF